MQNVINELKKGEWNVMGNKQFMIQKTLFIMTILLVSFLCSGVVLAKDTLVVGWDDWAPHQIVDKNGILVGANIELITEISNRAGFKVQFRKMPWKRNLVELESGTVDIALSASKTEERAKYANFSDTYFKLEYNVMFVRKSDKAKFSSIKSLKDIIDADFKVGATLGSVYSDEYEELLKNKKFTDKVQNVSEEKLNVEKLMKGRIDGFIADELGGISLIKESGYENQIDILFYLYGEKDASSYLMFSKKSMTKEQVDKMNSALNGMKKDGSYKKIINKYKLGKN
jgi:polar amino acid transport system substrate-binding protein